MHLPGCHGSGMMHFFVGLGDGVGVGVGFSDVDGGGALVVECVLLGGGFVWCVDEDGASLPDVCELLLAGGDSAAVVVGV
jgi:hypothetical protein